MALEESSFEILWSLSLVVVVIAGLAELGRERLVSCELEVRGTTFLSAIITKKRKLPISTSPKGLVGLGHIRIYEYSLIGSG